MKSRTVLQWRAYWLAVGWMMVCTIVWLSLTPSLPKFGFGASDKLGHFAAYGALMFWFCQLFATHRIRAVYALGFTAMGVVLEFLQEMTGYRSFEWFDMLADAIGVCGGWAVGHFAGDRLIRRVDALLGPRT